jgi:hypothetical protein
MRAIGRSPNVVALLEVFGKMFKLRIIRPGF